MCHENGLRVGLEWTSSCRGTEGKLVGGASWCLRYKITMRGRKTV